MEMSHTQQDCWKKWPRLVMTGSGENRSPGSIPSAGEAWRTWASAPSGVIDSTRTRIVRVWVPQLITLKTKLQLMAFAGVFKPQQDTNNNFIGWKCIELNDRENLLEFLRTH